MKRTSLIAGCLFLFAFCAGTLNAQSPHMHRHEPNPQSGGVAHAARDGVRNVVEFQIEKDIPVSRAELANDRRSRDREQLISNLVKPTLIAEIVDELQRVLRRRNIEGDDRGRGHEQMIISEQ